MRAPVSYPPAAFTVTSGQPKIPASRSCVLLGLAKELLARFSVGTDDSSLWPCSEDIGLCLLAAFSGSAEEEVTERSTPADTVMAHNVQLSSLATLHFIIKV